MVGQRAAGLLRRFAPQNLRPLWAHAPAQGSPWTLGGWEEELSHPLGQIATLNGVKGALRRNPRPFLPASLCRLRPPVAPLTPQ